MSYYTSRYSSHFSVHLRVEPGNEATIVDSHIFYITAG